MQLAFTKMEGLGNDFILIDNTRGVLPQNTPFPGLAQKLCSRHFGIGADGIILILPSANADMAFRIFNSDGSEPQMCGNGMRCFAKYLYEKSILRKTLFEVETPAGIIIPEVFPEADGSVSLVRVDMGEPILVPGSIPFLGGGTTAIHETIMVRDVPEYITAVSMGNPHAVILVDDIDSVALKERGTAVENHPAFPEKTNVEFIQILNQAEMKMRVWERGAGETLACGTGACAALVAAHLNGKCGTRALIHLAGGDLTVEWNRKTNHIFKTGPANLVFEGTILI
ncbi:MAG: diaminopimelate epimerase [Pseudomonadota bacterium]